jgi:hypothetical protein
MRILSEMDPRQLGSVVGTVIFVGAFLFYVVSRIRGTKRTK